MEEVKEKTKIDAAKYDELLKMLKSDNKDAKVLALTIMDQSDFDKSKVFISILYAKARKLNILGDLELKDFEDLNRNLLEFCNSMGESPFSITVTAVFQAVKEQATTEELDFLLEIFELEVAATLTNMGFQFPDNIRLKAVYERK